MATLFSLNLAYTGSCLSVVLKSPLEKKGLDVLIIRDTIGENRAWVTRNENPMSEHYSNLQNEKANHNQPLCTSNIKLEVTIKGAGRSQDLICLASSVHSPREYRSIKQCTNHIHISQHLMHSLFAAFNYNNSIKHD